MAALNAHVTQVSHMTDLEAFLRQRLARMGNEAGFAEGRLAESFTVIRTE
jgi:hypothetical protein